MTTEEIQQVIQMTMEEFNVSCLPVYNCFLKIVEQYFSGFLPEEAF